MNRLPPRSTRTDTLFPYTTLFRSLGDRDIALDPATMTGDYTLPVEPGPRGCFGDIVTEGDLAFGADHVATIARFDERSEEHTSELQSLMRNSYAVFCLKKKKRPTRHRRLDTDTYNRCHHIHN